MMTESEVMCRCGHVDALHVVGGYRMNTGTGKSHWKRFCQGHKGYDTLRGETPCRCKGYERQP